MRLRFAGLLLAAACGAAIAADTPKGAGKDKAEPVPVFDKKYLSSAANIKAGKEVWQSQCRHCHGAAAYPGKAPKLNPGMLEPDFIYDRVTYGFGKMPGWKEVFSLEQRKSVVAYVKSPGFSP
jgi:mono/diheme cytochrome c family protein